MKPLHSNPPRFTAKGRQKGAVLIVSLMMMLLLTIIGVTAMNNVTMEERMAGNLRDGDLSFQAAESALRDGENVLAGLLAEPPLCTNIGSPPATCNDVWSQGVLTDLSSQSAGLWSAISRQGASLAGVPANPGFLLEELNYIRDSLVVGHTGMITGSDYYKVTTRATGGSQSAITILQTTYVKRYN